MGAMTRRRWSPTEPGRAAVPPGIGRRQHGAEPHGDRGELERTGWRTTLEYRENHVRERDGRLRLLRVEWRAEAERPMSTGGAPIVIWASGSTLDKVWSRLRSQADLVDVGRCEQIDRPGGVRPARPSGRPAARLPAATVATW
jgi:hypothetical protein